jgi:hypothetical protein
MADFSLEASNAHLQRLTGAMEQTKALYEGAAHSELILRNELMLNYIHAVRAFNDYLLSNLGGVQGRRPKMKVIPWRKIA